MLTARLGRIGGGAVAAAMAGLLSWSLASLPPAGTPGSPHASMSPTPAPAPTVTKTVTRTVYRTLQPRGHHIPSGSGTPSVAVRLRHAHPAPTPGTEAHSGHRAPGSQPSARSSPRPSRPPPSPTPHPSPKPSPSPSPSPMPRPTHTRAPGTCVNVLGVVRACIGVPLTTGGN